MDIVYSSISSTPKEALRHLRHPKKERYPDISDTLKRGSKEMWHFRKHKKTATARDNDGIRCEAAAVRDYFSSVGAKYIKCNNIIIHIKAPHSRKAYCLG